MPRTAWTLHQFPLAAEQVVEEAVVPLHRVGGPCALKAAGDCVAAFAASKSVLPAETLLLEAGSLGFGSDILARIRSPMGFAKRVSASNKRNGLLVIHGHAAERLSNVSGCSERIRDSIWPLRIHVNQAHLDGTERILEFPVATVTLVSKPRGLRPPVNVLFGLPDVFTPTCETERLESHRLQGTITGEDHQIGPRDPPAVLLLNRPKQPSGLVEAHIVGPAVEGRKTLCAGGSAAAAVVDAVRASAVPRHPNEERPIVTVVSRPPVLRRRHQLCDVRLQCVQVKCFELLTVVEILAHWIRLGRVLVENLQVQLIRPPVLVRRGPNRRMSMRSAQHRAFAFGRHILSDRVLDGFPNFSAYSDDESF